MALDAVTAHELIRKLNEDRNAYLESVHKTTELLIQAIAASGNTTVFPQLTQQILRRGTDVTIDVEHDPKNSIFTGEEDSDSENTDSHFAQTPLQAEVYDEEGLKRHLRTYEWSAAGKQILQNAFTDERILRRQPIFPTELGDVDDRSHLTHYSIFDVGPNGVPVAVKTHIDRSPESRSMAIWNRLKKTNADPDREHKAVGRITIVREPSPLLFGALHYTMHQHFDVDEMFSFMVDYDPVLTQPHRAFSDDDRHQRSFVFNMEYFTIIGDNCLPPPWQHADAHHDITDTHIPISRCSAVIALSFEGLPSGKVRNKNRRVRKRNGHVFDPFSPWRVLSITSYPDWHSSVETHDSTKNYVNGPEAFLFTLRDEFRDAAKRLMAVYKTITTLVEPPSDFIFNEDTRDKLLFEDTNFTYSRRYFWAAQTLGIMNKDIRDMIEAFQDTFTDSIWDGTDKIVWPEIGAGDEASSRWANWRKRMAMLRRELNTEISHLESIEKLNESRMRAIKGLHDNLFSGTSVHESRRSVEQAAITVEQGRNIKLLTLVTIFFLPLTFVTSVYGMTNMDPNDPFNHFAWTCVAICVPTYLIIFSLNTQTGLGWWSTQPRAAYAIMIRGIMWIFNRCGYEPAWAKVHYQRTTAPTEGPMTMRPRKQRSKSTELAMLKRQVSDNVTLLSHQATNLSHQVTKTGSPGTSTPEIAEKDVVSNGTPSEEKEAQSNAAPALAAVKSHKRRYFKSTLSTIFAEVNETPTSSNTILPVVAPDLPEKLEESEPEPCPDEIRNQRKESLAGLVEFWQWQKNGRGKSKAHDIC